MGDCDWADDNDGLCGDGGICGAEPPPPQQGAPPPGSPCDMYEPSGWGDVAYDGHACMTPPDQTGLPPCAFTPEMYTADAPQYDSIPSVGEQLLEPLPPGACGVPGAMMEARPLPSPHNKECGQYATWADCPVPSSQDLRETYCSPSESGCATPLTPTCLDARYIDDSQTPLCGDPGIMMPHGGALARLRPPRGLGDPPAQVVTMIVPRQPDGELIGGAPVAAPPSPGGWRAVMSVQGTPPPLPQGAIRIVHPTGAAISLVPRWESATVREARVAVAAEWCVPAQSIRLHCPNSTERPNPTCIGTALADELLLSACAAPGDELFAVPLCAAHHLKDPARNRNMWRQKPLPERLQCAGTMLPALAENARDCSTLQRELDAARELGRADWCDGVLDAVARHCHTLLTHPCGNYLLRHCVECWPQRFVNAVLSASRGRAAQLSCDRHASYVLQAVLAAAPASAAAALVEELLLSAERLCADASGNYVLQTAIDESPACMLRQLERRVQPVVAGCAHAPKMRRKLELRLRTRRRASERERGGGRARDGARRGGAKGGADAHRDGLQLIPFRDALPASESCWADSPLVE